MASFSEAWKQHLQEPPRIRYRGNSEANVDSSLSRDCEVDGDKRFLGTLIT